MEEDLRKMVIRVWRRKAQFRNISETGFGPIWAEMPMAM